MLITRGRALFLLWLVVQGVGYILIGLGGLNVELQLLEGSFWHLSGIGASGKLGSLVGTILVSGGLGALLVWGANKFSGRGVKKGLVAGLLIWVVVIGLASYLFSVGILQYCNPGFRWVGC